MLEVDRENECVTATLLCCRAAVYVNIDKYEVRSSFYCQRT